MKDKREEEEKLEKQKKKKDSKALFSKTKGKEKEENDSSKKIVNRKTILQQKVISKDHSFLNNPSTFSYKGKHPLALPHLLGLSLFLK